MPNDQSNYLSQGRARFSGLEWAMTQLFSKGNGIGGLVILQLEEVGLDAVETTVLIQDSESGTKTLYQWPVPRKPCHAADE